MNRIADNQLVDFQQFLFLVSFKLLFSDFELVLEISNFVENLVAFFLEFRLLFDVFLYLLVVFADLSDSFEVLVIVFNHSDVRFFIIIFELLFGLII